MRIIVRFRQVDKPQFQSGAADPCGGHGLLRVQILDVVHLFALLIKIFLESKTTCRLFWPTRWKIKSATKKHNRHNPSLAKVHAKGYTESAVRRHAVV